MECKFCCIYLCWIQTFFFTLTQTLKNAHEATVTLKDMQEQWQCSDDTLKQWVAQVKEWASTGKIMVVV